MQLEIVLLLLSDINLFKIWSRVLHSVAKYYVCHTFLFLEKRIITLSKSYHQMTDGWSEILLEET